MARLSAQDNLLIRNVMGASSLVWGVVAREIPLCTDLVLGHGLAGTREADYGKVSIHNCTRARRNRMYLPFALGRSGVRN